MRKPPSFHSTECESSSSRRPKQRTAEAEPRRSKLSSGGRPGESPASALRESGVRTRQTDASEELMNQAAAGDTVNILYGKTGLDIRLPRNARATVIGKRPMPKLPD